MTSRTNVRGWLAIPASLLLLVSVAGCGPAGEDEGAREGAAAPPATETATPPRAAAPPQAATPPQPAAGPAGAYPCISGEPQAGQQLYVVFCASCHGTGGNGDGPAAVALDPRPARHTDGAYMNPLSNEHVFKVIELGGGAVGKSPLMAPWGGTLSDEQIWHLVAFVRSLSEPAYACP